jgi:hypothetical protein
MPAEISERGFTTPASFLTKKAWTETGVVSDGYSKGFWVSDNDGVLALRKPGFQTPDGVEAFREIVAAQIARWLGVRTPATELQVHPSIGPVCLSMELEGALFTFVEVFGFADRADLTKLAHDALSRHGGVVVLDCLVGACDRHNPGNHNFALDEGEWYSLDYGQSFNQRLDRTGVEILRFVGAAFKTSDTSESFTRP